MNAFLVAVFAAIISGLVSGVTGALVATNWPQLSRNVAVRWKRIRGMSRRQAAGCLLATLLFVPKCLWLSVIFVLALPWYLFRWAVGRAVAPLLGAVNAQIGTANAQIGAVNAHFGTANAQIGTANAQIGAVNTHVGAVSAHVGAVSAQIGAANARIDALTNRFSRIERRLGPGPAGTLPLAPPDSALLASVDLWSEDQVEQDSLGPEAEKEGGNV